MTNSLGGVQLSCCQIVFLLPGSDGDPTVGLGGGSPLQLARPLATAHPPRLSEVVDMWGRKHTVFAVIAFIAAILMFMVHWHHAGEVSQSKTETDCQKAGGIWDMNMCIEK